MNTPQAPKQSEAPKPEELRGFDSWCHLSDYGLCSNFRYFQAMLISTSSQKRREAVERRIVIEDVVE